jgi:hypothetical protein
MKQILIVAIIATTIFTSTAQEINIAGYAKDALSVDFSKKPVERLQKLAIAQNEVLFKTVTTLSMLKTERGAFGGRKSGGKAVQVRQVAYLEFSDGEMSNSEYQELANYCTQTMYKKAEAAGFATVDASTISNSNAYKEFDADNEEEDKEKFADQVYKGFNAYNGKTISKYVPLKRMTGLIAFGKQKKINRLAEELQATLALQTLVVDFVDIKLEADVKSGTSETSLGGGLYRVSNWANYKADGDLFANIKIVGANGMGGRIVVADEKAAMSTVNFKMDIPSLVPYATDMVNDDTKNEVKAKRDNIFAKDFNGIPKVIKTTKAAYKTAVMKAFDNYADVFIEKIKQTKN